MRILIGSAIVCFPVCAETYAASVRESQRGGGNERSLSASARFCRAPSPRSTPWRGQCRRPAPDLPARYPGAARDLIIELTRCPAGIAKCDQASLRPMAVTEIAQHPRGLRQCHAGVDVHRVRQAVIRAVQREGDIGTDRTAEKYDDAVGDACGIRAERAKHRGDRTARNRMIDDEA